MSVQIGYIDFISPENYLRSHITAGDMSMIKCWRDDGTTF